MAPLCKILILCAGLVFHGNIWAQNSMNSQQPGKGPLRIEHNYCGAPYYTIDKKALDFGKADYSDVYESYLTPIDGSLAEDCTRQFKKEKLQLEPQFLNTYAYWRDMPFEAPVNGVLGNDFRRIEVYFYPQAVKIDSLTYAVRGRTKVKGNICNFAGEIRIKKIYHILGCDKEMPDDYYVVIAECWLNEDVRQNGSGKFRGIFGAYGYVTESEPGIIKVDDRYIDADGYENRTFVGTWQSYSNPSLVKRCVWGDYRLPFTFDFDIGDGEMRVNPKYASPEWDRVSKWEDLDIVEPESGDSRASYKNPWW